MKLNACLAGFAGFALAAAALALPPAAGPAAAAQADFPPEAFRAHVAFLADDLLEGREAGTRGYDLAARYVASQFEALGLEPGAGPSPPPAAALRINDGWFQPIEFVRYRHGGTPRLTINGRGYVHGDEIVIRPSPQPGPATIEAPMAFAGYGIDMPGRGFDDYTGLDVEGRIVVLLDGYPRGTPSDVGAHLGAEKARMAARRGAVGLIVVRAPRRDGQGTLWARYRRMADRPETTWLSPAGEPFAGSGIGFTATIDGAAAAGLFAGAPRTLEQVIEEAAREGGRPRGFALAHQARLERHGAETSRFSSANVIGLLPGTDPALADEYVLLTAHLDGLGIAGSGDGDRIRNGAMDNATGVATLIEVARHMSRPGNRPRRPVLFAALTAEEKGLLGAEYLAHNPVVDGRIAAVVNLDMPILTYDFEDVIAFGAEHSTLGPIVERAAARMGVAVAPDPLPEQGLFTRSDHYKFVREGVPSVFLMTGFAGEGRERFTGFLRGPYHGPDDDLNLPFDWQAGAKFARLNYLIAREIANAEAPPLWYADSFFGEVFGGAQPRAPRIGAAAGSEPN